LLHDLSVRGAWRLLIATEIFDKHGPLEAYRRILQILESIGIPLALQEISVVSERNSLIKLLKSVVTTEPDSTEGIPLSARLIDRVYVDDAYIYRMV
jgi:hypothetical protein